MTRLTAEQRAVIAAERGHLLVDAGAGTGKTTTVVRALCRQLGIAVASDGEPLSPVATPLTIEQVAAITYTNQAAADLKRKLRGALRDGGRADLASEVDSARIGTIHSFCGELLRDFALRAGVRPGRRVLDDGEASALVWECAHEAVRLAIGAGDVPGLDSLLSGRKVRDVSEWIAKAAQDTDRLDRWAAGAAALREHERALLAVALRAAALRRERLEFEGALDFDQMIVAARALLLDADVRRAVQGRLRLLVLDEFQDVDPAQRDIAFLLGGLEHPDPAPTRLILVGDPKQSIYRFRRADVTLWNAVKERFAGGAGQVLPLAANFRSKAAILGLVDCAVGAALAAPVDPDGGRRSYEVDYAPLEARAAHSAGDRAVELLVVEAGDDGKAQAAGHVRELEAEAVARRIAALHAAGTPYGDVAILLAGWGAVGAYEGALRALGVPTYVLRSEGFWQAREVLDCLLALRAIRDPSDDVAIAGFLKSPFVGVRDDTLLALARAADGRGLAAALGEAGSERPLLERALHLLRTLGALRDRVSVHDLLRRLLDESGFLAAAALSAGGPQCAANLRKLVRVAAATPDASLGEFLRTVAEQRDRDDRVAPERLYRERSDVVTITSIHSAKGLEWPVVFWCDMVRQVTPEHAKFLTARDSFSVKDESLTGEDAKPGDAVHTRIADELALEQRAEAYRLWYVASTRAQERLVLSGIPLGESKRGALSPARMVRELFPELGTTAEAAYRSHDGTVYHAVVIRSAAVAPADAAEAPVAAPALPLPPASRAAPSGGARLSATQLMAFGHDPQRWWERYVLRFDGPADGSVGRAAARAIATGLIVHEVLERFGVDGVDLEELIEGAIANNDADGPERDSVAGAAWREHIRRRVDAATGSPEWSRMARAPSARRELPFTRLLADGTAISGVLDLASRDGGSARVLDVKTSDADPRVLAGRYEVQAAVYEDAVRAIAGVPDVSFTLLPVPSGKGVEVTPTVDVEALVARLRAAETSAAGAMT